METLAKSSGIEDSLIMFETFPEEVWEKILANVHKPEEYELLENVSPVFKMLRRPHRTRLLFTEALPNLQAYCDYQTKEGIKPLLNLRFVCHAWKHGVDTLLENLPENYLFPEEFFDGWRLHPNESRVRDRQFISKTFSRPRDVNEFHAKFDTSHLPRQINPWVGRSIKLFLSFDTPFVSRYLESLLRLLRLYGAHVWFLHLHVEANFTCSLAKVGTMQWLKDLLLLLPNLRKLTFTFGVPNNLPNVLENVEEYWMHNDMPTLPHLKMIAETMLPLTLLMALLKANPQVTILKTVGLAVATRPQRFIPREPPLLETLSITFPNANHLYAFETTPLDWPLLTKLSITVEGTNNPLETILQVVETKFGNYLQDLLLSVWGYRRTEQNLPLPTIASLNMPNLRRFHITSPFANYSSTLRRQHFVQQLQNL